MASEYGWSKQDILYDVYFDELAELVKKINKRKVNEYKMQLAIAHNPHVKNYKELWRILERQDDEQHKKSEEFDPVGFEQLKSVLSNNPRIIVKS